MSKHDEIEPDQDHEILCRSTEQSPHHAYSESGFVQYFLTHDFSEEESSMLGFPLEARDMPGNLVACYAHREVLFIQPTPSDPYFTEVDGLEYFAFDTDENGVWRRTEDGVEHTPLWQWLTLKNVRDHSCVGRFLRVFEVSGSALAMLHYIMDSRMMRVFSEMLRSHVSSIHSFNPLERNESGARHLLVHLSYVTIADRDYEPLSWQLSDLTGDTGYWMSGLPLSRCNIVIGLYFAGRPRKTDFPDRRLMNDHVFDPCASWQVLTVEAKPNSRWSYYERRHAHEHVPHRNGPEAFLYTLIDGVKDFRIRTERLVDRICALVQPPADAPFSRRKLNDLLFDDKDFSNSRKYFWASQTLEIMQQDLHQSVAMIERVFTDEVWESKDPYIWPLNGLDDPRRQYWCKLLLGYRRRLEKEFDRLRDTSATITARQKQITNLFDNLYSMTSVKESRLSAEMASATVYQGRNIKLLTVVSLIYLPLSFVAAIFGMTNMPQNLDFRPFGYTLAAICLPTYLLLVVLLPTQGLDFWRQKTVSNSSPKVGPAAKRSWRVPFQKHKHHSQADKV
ncbi:MAG: hypothetical protein M1828_007366 [Chrysothrix sp. TS-e1954]|nr:MAG: hypothetical protein M1828_007366 [Chrysothrix sp. TS-e1954]